MPAAPAGSLYAGQRSVGFRAAVAEELPGVADLADEIPVHIMGDELVLVAAGDCLDDAAWVDEIALSVELADIPRRFRADPVDRADVTAVCHRRGRLLQFPEMLRESGNRC